MRFHHAAQNDGQFKTSELFISEIFHLIILDHGLPWKTETVDKGGTVVSTFETTLFPSRFIF